MVLKNLEQKSFFFLQQLCSFIKNLKKSYVSNPLSGCVITWLGLLHMDNLAVLWDKILMFNLKNHGCALEIINTEPGEGAQNQNKSYTLSFVMQMLQAIWLAGSVVCNCISKWWQCILAEKKMKFRCFEEVSPILDFSVYTNLSI